MTDPSASGFAEAAGQTRAGVVDVSEPPYGRDELLRSIWKPHAGMEIALGCRGRMIASIEAADHLGLLSGALLIVSVVAAVPYGLIAPTESNPFVPDGLRIVLLYVGSLALCFPSLHVFATFLGLRLRGLQVLALAVLVTAVAASFSFGFFPITWFIALTTDAEAASSVDAGTLSALLLVLGLAMGIAQLARCVLSELIRSRTSLLPVLFACWLVLLVFIVHRMAGLLGLW